MIKKKQKWEMTLNSLFLIILGVGVFTLIVVFYVLLTQERDRSVKKWQMDMLQKSSAATSSYYANLITSLVLEKQREVQNILNISKRGENLQSIDIVPQSNITSYILKTCEVDKKESFFHQVPTCFEIKDNSLVIYHELRSTGYNVGYLRKEIALPVFGLLRSNNLALKMGFVVLCFVFVSGITLFCIRRYFIGPIRMLTHLLGDKNDLTIETGSFRIKELRLLADSIKKSFAAVKEYQSREKAQEYEVKLGKMSSQVAHDIRSPLAALQVAAMYTSKLPEEQRILIRSAIQRIDDIANVLAGRDRLSKKTEGIEEELSVQLLSSLIDSLISEKRMQYRARLGVKIESWLNESSYGLFARVEPIKFKRVLSNLVNNALEAVGDLGIITVDLTTKDNEFCLAVSDNGKGIPKDVISKLMEKGATFNKEGGSGLGLYHAKEAVKSWGGSIGLKSEVARGTRVEIKLPRAGSPGWFVPELKIFDHSSVIVLDDDNSIHQIWKGRFQSLPIGKDQVFHFTSPYAITQWFGERNWQNQHFIFLCDYELIGSDDSGLDVIERLGVAKHAILVTSRFDDDEVREKCNRLGVKLLPKSLAGFVPIKYVRVTCDTEYILIDDDPSNHEHWQLVARMRGKKLATFSGPAEFYTIMDRLAKDTKIYIDANLGPDIKGETIARDIHELGFEYIYMTTGADKSRFSNMPWIKGIIGKTPPFFDS